MPTQVPFLRPRPSPRGVSPTCIAIVLASLAVAVFSLSAITLSFANAASPRRGATASPRLTSDLTGGAPVRDGQRLHLVADIGNIVIHTQDSGKLDYRVHLETDASQAHAKELLKRFSVNIAETSDGVFLRGRTIGRPLGGRLWVTFDVNVPKDFNLDVSTGGGSIQVEDLHGRLILTTAGGNLTTGNVSGSAHLETDGGHIIVKNVGGDLSAVTGGGHITAGDVAGNAMLHTTGGHIHVSSVGGTARFETGGGNVALEHAAADLIAETGGGQIEVGETAGIVRAKTGGGGIRVVHVTGPANLQTDSGSIYLTQVDSAVHASTEAGGITAWFVSPSDVHHICELQSGDGDIVVYLSPELPVTIDAQVQLADRHRVIVDPAFPLKVSYQDSADGSRTVRAEGALNGGGEVLRLRTLAGNIHLIACDVAKHSQMYKQQMGQIEQQVQLYQHEMEQLQQQMQLQMRIADPQALQQQGSQK
ncbi:MAG: hypothetical protein WBF56_14070 [Candidatus Acidiferrales bacterium]